MVPGAGGALPYDALLIAIGAEPVLLVGPVGLRLQVVGTATGRAHVELEGDSSSFRARYVGEAGEAQGVLLANRPGEVATARRELASAA